MKHIVNAGPTIRVISGRIGQKSCRNMLRRPRRDKMPVKVDVPTRSKASRVAEDNSAMRTSHSPPVLATSKPASKKRRAISPTPVKAGKTGRIIDSVLRFDDPVILDEAMQIRYLPA